MKSKIEKFEKKVNWLEIEFTKQLEISFSPLSQYSEGSSFF